MITLFKDEEQIKEYYRKKASIQITKDNCNTEFKKAVLENRKNLISKFTDIKELKKKIKEPAIRKRVSNVLLLLAIVMTLVTTFTTIAGGLNYYKTIFNKVTFIGFISFAQFTILIISCLKPYLSMKAPKYINISFFVQICLLTVSISYNFMFMYNSKNNIFLHCLVLILCILFDITVLLICEIALTIRLNIEFVKIIKNNDTIFTRIIDIFKSLIDYKLTVIEYSIKNKIQLANENMLINDIDIKKYLDFAKNNIKDNNQLPSYKDIGKQLSIPERKAKNIHQTLLTNGITKTENNKTFLVG
jgi:hypothetical protein